MTVLRIDHDGDVFMIYNEIELYDTAGSAEVVDEIIEDCSHVDSVEWTAAAVAAAGRGGSSAIEAVAAAVEQLSELNIKVVNLANMLEGHLKEVDAHHPALMGKKKK